MRLNLLLKWIDLVWEIERYSNEIEVKEQEEDIRQLALQTLEELYCMNCFQLHENCTCMNNEIGVSSPIKEKPVWVKKEW